MGTPMKNTTGRIKRQLSADWLYRWGDTPERMNSMEAMFEAAADACECTVEDVRRWPIDDLQTVIDEVMENSSMGNAKRSDPPSDFSTDSRSSSDIPTLEPSRPKWTPEPRSTGSPTSHTATPTTPRDASHAAMLGRR